MRWSVCSPTSRSWTTRRLARRTWCARTTRRAPARQSASLCPARLRPSSGCWACCCPLTTPRCDAPPAERARLPSRPSLSRSPPATCRASPPRATSWFTCSSTTSWACASSASRTRRLSARRPSTATTGTTKTSTPSAPRARRPPSRTSPLSPSPSTRSSPTTSTTPSGTHPSRGRAAAASSAAGSTGGSPPRTCSARSSRSSTSPLR
mmetsp:Transcript_41173/g.122777  ORF Transcript_41173/g.122777 Transcript_41173/m.122777 type:complete len:208 (-) Transcript_41173:547-1170(-)